MGYLLLAVIKILDNIVLTAKSIATYKGQRLMSSVLVVISQLLFYLVINQVINDDTILAIVIVSVYINPDANRTDYRSYYPGDEYVDWWAIDIFRAGSMFTDVTENFLADAEAHRKPVMLSECCPYTFDTAKTAVLDGWMEPFFCFIQEHPVIKAMYYINWNWPEHSDGWNHWGDSRLETAHPEVMAYYNDQLSQPEWLHAMMPEEVQQQLYGAESLSLWTN